MVQKYKADYLQRQVNPTHQIEDQTEETAPASQIYPAEKATTNELRRAVLQPGAASHATILNLQSRYGNHAVQRLLEKSTAPTVQRGVFGKIKESLKNTFSSKKDTKAFLIEGKNDEEIVDTLFADHEGRQVLEEYCEKEFAPENFYAYDSVLDYQQGPSLMKARQFQNNFIGKQAKYEINLPAAPVRNLNEGLTEADLGKVNLAILTPIKDTLKGNLQDTFSRFRLTKEFTEWLNSPRATDSIKF